MQNYMKLYYILLILYDCYQKQISGTVGYAVKKTANGKKSSKGCLYDVMFH